MEKMLTWYLNAFLAELNMDGQSKLADHMTKHVLIPAGTTPDVPAGSWRAEWQTGAGAGHAPGFTPDTISQSLESFWDAVKDALPVGICHRNLPTVVFILMERRVNFSSFIFGVRFLVTWFE